MQELFRQEFATDDTAIPAPHVCGEACESSRPSSVTWLGVCYVPGAVHSRHSLSNCLMGLQISKTKKCLGDLFRSIFTDRGVPSLNDFRFVPDLCRSKTNAYQTERIIYVSF